MKSSDRPSQVFEADEARLKTALQSTAKLARTSSDQILCKWRSFVHAASKEKAYAAFLLVQELRGNTPIAAHIFRLLLSASGASKD